jgi:uncharacterized protein
LPGGEGDEREICPPGARQASRNVVAINRPDAIQPAFDALLGVVDEVFPVDRPTAERAKQIVLGHKSLSARGAVHLAAMQAHDVRRILSFDRGFDGFPGIVRLL